MGRSLQTSWLNLALVVIASSGLVFAAPTSNEASLMRRDAVSETADIGSTIIPRDDPDTPGWDPNPDTVPDNGDTDDSEGQYTKSTVKEDVKHTWDYDPNAGKVPKRSIDDELYAVDGPNEPEKPDVLVKRVSVTNFFRKMKNAAGKNPNQQKQTPSALFGQTCLYPRRSLTN